MQSFEFYSPTRIIFGAGTESQVGAQAAAHGGHRVLVVYGGQSAKKSGLLDRVCHSLTQAGLTYQLFGGVQPNPRLLFTRTGVEQALAFKADFILALGGGSAIDTAKAISVGAANPGHDVWDIWLKKAPINGAIPVGVVLTISAAGSESSDSAVLTNDDTLEKRGIGHDLFRPKFAIMNPQLTLTLPPYQVACGVVDIMMHTLDRYFNPVSTNEMTDVIALGLLRTVIANGRRAMDCPGDEQAMSELMWAGSLSHNGLTGLGGEKDFAPHQLGHELSAQFDVAHGATLSAVWESWARYCLDTNPTRFVQYAATVWDIETKGRAEREVAREAIEATSAYFRSLGMPTTLPGLGCGVLEEGVLEEMAKRCVFYGARMVGTFRVLGYEDILAIYRMANHN